MLRCSFLKLAINDRCSNLVQLREVMGEVRDKSDICGCGAAKLNIALWTDPQGRKRSFASGTNL